MRLMNQPRNLTKKFLFTAAAAIAAVGVCCGQAWAVNDLLAGWTFEINTPADLTDSVIGPLVLNDGGGTDLAATLQGFHILAATDCPLPPDQFRLILIARIIGALAIITKIKVDDLLSDGYRASVRPGQQ